jgi:hypothetical protein
VVSSNVIHQKEIRLSAGYDFDASGNENGQPSKPCAVVSIYEDLGGRDLLLRLCDSLVQKFSDDLEFHIDWWRFKYLADPEIAMEAAHSAARADLILFASESSVLPLEVRAWFEGWLPNRADADGALVLVQPSSEGALQSLSLRTYLRRLAKRARLDYLRLTFPNAWAGVAKAVAGLSPFQLDGKEIPAPGDLHPHWGINE